MEECFKYFFTRQNDQVEKVSSVKDRRNVGLLKCITGHDHVIPITKFKDKLNGGRRKLNSEKALGC
jgi:hypothetical protein